MCVAVTFTLSFNNGSCWGNKYTGKITSIEGHK